jgi:hypothetical protein
VSELFAVFAEREREKNKERERQHIYTLKVVITELFSKAILLPMFVYGDCMAVG